jgi:hypothetical protein
MADPGAMAMFVSHQSLMCRANELMPAQTNMCIYSGPCHKTSRGTCAGPCQFHSDYAKERQRRAAHRQNIRQVHIHYGHLFRHFHKALNCINYVLKMYAFKARWCLKKRRPSLSLRGASTRLPESIYAQTETILICKENLIVYSVHQWDFASLKFSIRCI